MPSRMQSAARHARIALRAVEIRSWRRAPDIGLARDPGLRPLRGVLVPGPRLEIAELFVLHLVELAVKLDHLIVRIAMIGGDVVTRYVTQRSPDDRNLLLSEQVA